eukprot:8746454-Alexandrium_andersonii.AAC.1
MTDVDAVAGRSLQPRDAGDHDPTRVRVARVLLKRGVAEEGCDVLRLAQLDRWRPGALLERRLAAVVARGSCE